MRLLPLLALALIQSLEVVRAIDSRPVCHNYHTDFSKSMGEWFEVDGEKATNEQITKDGLKIKLLPPDNLQTLRTSSGFVYNKYEGRGATFNATSLMHYGTISAKIKAAAAGGAVTAFILIADDGDEIDFEFVGADPRHVQTNYFWGKNIVYGVNGGNHAISGSAYDEFHTYKMDWSPERIVWSVDGSVVRTKYRSQTYHRGAYEYPTAPARAQIGLWDGSTAPGTAQWCNGPIDWHKNKNIAAYIKEIEVTCDPQYNKVEELKETKPKKPTTPKKPTKKPSKKPSKKPAKKPSKKPSKKPAKKPAKKPTKPKKTNNKKH
ncbi:hypothetical protein DFQ28_005700 [Apophysomyces sp. BC1034]|nr:hypothetical protein DFQ30_002113 [Apophysomyces sp. BC1015]KAG0179419.1 hypothetical protein DFQ29_002105 [Apophysomyces sp. BC1021]KAG0187886.1 hypothetical protein DFQ28_005700 [Apophysomyces sp. BC1034]